MRMRKNAAKLVAIASRLKARTSALSKVGLGTRALSIGKGRAIYGLHGLSMAEVYK